jgi:hypothetical protein
MEEELVKAREWNSKLTRKALQKRKTFLNTKSRILISFTVSR